MPSLKKSTIAQTFKFDCDRFLRFSLMSGEERNVLGLKGELVDYRPGIDLVKYAGTRWEIEKYEDLIDVSPPGSVIYQREESKDEKIGKRRFKKIDNLFGLLRREKPPVVIIEGEFLAPKTITPALEEAYEKYDLDPAAARPDILWLRRYPTGAPLIGGPKDSLKYEIHIIDVKMAAEPSLRHFTEVTYYALALAAALKEERLDDRYAVSARGFIWPGSHDAHAFRNLYRDFSVRGTANPVSAALEATIVGVPYEVYEVHVKQFFEERLLRVLSQPPEKAAWHVSPKCQLCEFLPYCEKQAKDTDHLSRLAWLTNGQANLLRKNNFHTTKELAQAIERNALGWQSAVKTSHQLKADSAVLRARVEALQKQQPVLAEGRVSPLMPKWAHMRIYLTVNFDMGTGITFAMGARRIFFHPANPKGTPPLREFKPFIVDRVTGLNTDSERARFLEFIDVVSGWLAEADELNSTLSKGEKISVHFFFWDSLEVKQIGRMFERHISDPEVAEKTELLIRFFPHKNEIPDPDIFKSQPGTIVREVFRTMVGVPVAHDYTLFEVANSFYPFQKEDGSFFKYGVPYGFEYPMTDQIPMERAYELWQDKIYLPHPKYDRKYNRGEILEGITNALEGRLKALEHVVNKLVEHHKDRLVLKKSAFSAAPRTQTKVPEKARSLIAFTELNAVVDEIKNRQSRALPVEEREARFISIRGLLPARGQQYEDAINDARREHPKFAVRRLLPMTFSSNSRDCRLKEGDWLLAVSNEEANVDLDVPWRKHLEIEDSDEAKQLLAEHGLDENRYLRTPLSGFLQVEVALLNTATDPPFLVLSPANDMAFRFAQAVGLLDLNRSMVIDPIYKDFSTDRVIQALTLIGGDFPKIKQRRKR
jgi:hypothetical protein